MPRSHLTVAALNRIKPPSKGGKSQVDHFDTRCPGLTLRVSYGGSSTWAFAYRCGGKQRRLKLGTYPALGLAEAREAWRAARAKLDKGEDPAAATMAARNADGFEAVVEDWLKRDQADNLTVAEVERIMRKHVLPEWGHLRIAAITRRQVAELIDDIADRGTPTSALRCYARLNRLFRWAVGRGIIETSPMLYLPKPAEEVKRKRVLTDDELRRVWVAAQQIGWPIGSAIQLLILTCARRDQIGALRWQEVTAAHIRLGDRTKNDEDQDIPLSAAARDLIADIPRMAGSPFVFTTTGTTPISGWSRAKRNIDKAINAHTELDGWRIHDLRRTGATWMQANGIELQVVEAVLGHTAGSRAGVVGIYQRHTYAQEKRAAIELWGEHVASLVRGAAPRKRRAMQETVA